eukprot:Opistho-2@36995
MRLTLARVSEIAKGDVREIKSLDASKSEIDAVDDLNACVELRKLNLSENELQSLTDLSYCNWLTWLNVSHNHLSTLRGIEWMSQLNVLNASHNEIAEISVFPKLKNLKALVLNNNRIAQMETVAGLTGLNTLVLSHNKIAEIKGTKPLRALTKLSVAHNKIRVVPDLSDNDELVELRLNDNKIMRLPDTLKSNPKLKTIDFGNNLIKSIADIEVIGLLRGLTNINLKGNLVCEVEGYADKVRELCPTLLVLDGKRVIPRKNQVRQLLKQVALDRAEKSRSRGDRFKGRTPTAPSGDGEGSADTDADADADADGKGKASEEGEGAADAMDGEGTAGRAASSRIHRPTGGAGDLRGRGKAPSSFAKGQKRFTPDDARHTTAPAPKHSKSTVKRPRESAEEDAEQHVTNAIATEGRDGGKRRKIGAVDAGDIAAAQTKKTDRTHVTGDKVHAKNSGNRNAPAKPSEAAIRPPRPTAPAEAAWVTTKTAGAKRKADSDLPADADADADRLGAPKRAKKGGDDGKGPAAAAPPQKTRSGVVAVEHVTRPSAGAKGKGSAAEKPAVDPLALFAKGWSDDTVGTGLG